jgi:hypothetical protein
VFISAAPDLVIGKRQSDRKHVAIRGTRAREAVLF